MKRFAVVLLLLIGSLTAQGQAVSVFGASHPEDTSKTKAQIVATAYANTNVMLFLTADASGHFVLDTVIADVDSTIFATIFGVDTAKQNIRAEKVSYSDSTGFLPTKTFLLNNYFKQGGNSFAATATVGTNDAQPFDIETNNTTRLRIFSNGNAAIGTTTDGGYKFEVSGLFRFGTYLQRSVIRGSLDFDNATNDAYITQANETARSIKIPGTGGNAPWIFYNTAGNGISVYNSTLLGNRVDVFPGGNNTTNPPKIFLSLTGLQTPARALAVTGTAASNVNLEIGSGEIIYSNNVGYNVIIRSGAGGAAGNMAGGNIYLTTGAGGGTGHAGYIIHSPPPEYADNAAALAAGLPIGTEYRTGDILKVVH